MKNAAKIAGAVAVVIGLIQSAVAKISTASYVQEGLVACWDGIENAGSSGNHVATLPNGQWRDTIRNIPLAMQGVTIGPDGVVFAGTSSSYGELTSANAVSTFNTCASQGTLEIVYVANSTASQMLLQGNSTAGISIGTLAGSTTILCWTGNTNKDYFTLPSGASWNSGVNTIAVTYEGANPKKLYFNDSVSEALSAPNQYWGGPNGLIFVGKRNNNNMPFSGKIYAIRLYSQVLTAEQLAANRAVDVKRFIDPPLEDGELEVMSIDGAQGETQPAMGITTGYVAGETVNFSWQGTESSPRRWTVLNCGDGKWKVVKHGYGQRGSLIYMEGGMRIEWEKELASPICRWTFDDQTGRNTGSLGADGDLEFSGSVSAANGYLTIPNNLQSFANTVAAVPLSTANGVTVGFWARNVTHRDAAIFGLSEYYGSNAGCFGGWWGANHIWSGAFRVVTGSDSGQSIVQYSLSASQDVMADGQWHFATFVFRKTTWPNIEIYLDGQALSDKVSASKLYERYDRDTSDATFADDQKFYLGYYDGKNSAYGDFDEMAIYPQELASNDVEDLYQQERRAGKVVPFVPSAEENLLMVTVRGVVPSEALPTPMLDTFIECEEGEVQSFDSRRQMFTVVGRKRKVALMRWTLYLHVEGEWTAYASGGNRLIEFVHPGGAVKLELEFGVPSTVFYLK